MKLCTVLYELLLIEVDENREFDLDVARKSYRNIMWAIHTDKNPDPYAKIATQSVIKAWQLLSNPETRDEYKQYGVIEGEELDWRELDNGVDFVRTAMGLDLTYGFADQAVLISDDEEEEHCHDRMDDGGPPSKDSGYSSTYINDEQQSTEDRTAADTSSENAEEDGPSDSSKIHQNSFREQIKEIKGHRNRRGTLKFLVQWDIESLDPIWETKETILNGHEGKLVEYLSKLQVHHKRSFVALIRSFPDLGLLLKN